MNRKHRLELIARSLLLPYFERSLISQDFILESARGYSKLINSDSNYLEIKKEYEKARRNFQTYLENDFRHFNLDDAELMIEKFYPQSKISQYFGEGLDGGWYYFDKIQEITDAFLTLREGHVAIKYKQGRSEILELYEGYNKVELWQTVSRIVMPDIFIAAYFLNTDMGSELEYLIDIPNILPLHDEPLLNIFKKGVAETHLHFNAGAFYTVAWGNLMNFVIHSENAIEFYSRKGVIYQYLGIYRYLFGEYLEVNCTKQGEEVSFLKYIALKFEDNSEKKFVFDLLKKIEENEEVFSKPVEKEKIQILDEKLCLNKTQIFDLLEVTIYKKYNLEERNISEEIVFLYKTLDYLKKNYRKKNNESELKMFINYLRHKNYYFGDKIQSNKIGGLKFFQNYFNNATDNIINYKEKINIIEKNELLIFKYKIIFREQLRTPNLRKLEIKVTPPKINIVFREKHKNDALRSEYKILIFRQIKAILTAYKSIIEEKKQAGYENEKHLPSVGIVYHFIKAMSADNFSGKICHFIKNEMEFSEYNDYWSLQEKSIQFIYALFEIFKEIPLLSEYIVGIDAASQELATEPWVFAPVFKTARGKEITLPSSTKFRRDIQNLGFTYHIGEEFRHILSGLRHIDEVLTYFSYYSGDRLGHATALGIDIEHWLRMNEIVTIPAIEHLDNLVWLWGSNESGVFINRYKNLDYEIMETAKKIFPSIKGITPFLLWEVYEKKFIKLDERCKEYLDKEFLKRTEGDLSQKKCKGTEHCIFPIHARDDMAWNEDKLLCAFYCPAYFIAQQKCIFVKVDLEQLSFYKEIQNLLIKKVEQNGIYVETNPTSNTAIGDIDGLLSHPAIYLNNRNLGKHGINENAVMVTINSDDPMVFNTNIENEMAYIYYALIAKGYNREEVLQWIDKIRDYGMTSSFIRKVKTIEEITVDLEQLLSYDLKKYGIES